MRNLPYRSPYPRSLSRIADLTRPLGETRVSPLIFNEGSHEIEVSGLPVSIRGRIYNYISRVDPRLFQCGWCRGRDGCCGRGYGAVILTSLCTYTLWEIDGHYRESGFDFQ
jgi:hypothetical protein